MKLDSSGVCCIGAVKEEGGEAKSYQHHLKIKSKCCGVFEEEVTATSSLVSLALRR